MGMFFGFMSGTLYGIILTLSLLQICLEEPEKTVKVRGEDRDLKEFE